MTNNTQEKYFEFALLLLIFIIGYALYVQIIPFINGILGAITLYILLRKYNFKLTNKLSATKAAWIITIIVTLFVLIPLSLISWYVIDLIQGLKININDAYTMVTSLIKGIEDKLNISLMTDKSLSYISAKFSSFANYLLLGVNNFAVNLATAILVLFFLLLGGKSMEDYVAKTLPFNNQNKQEVIKKIYLIVRSNALGIPLLAILQGVIATIGYALCNINNPILLGFLTGFSSIIPVVGTMIVWIPVGILAYITGNTYGAIGLIVYGLVIISQCDNVIRLILQKKLANTHPLITIFGVIAGLPIFGFMGIIFGPLIVALFILFLDMFTHQYIINENKITNKK